MRVLALLLALCLGGITGPGISRADPVIDGYDASGVLSAEVSPPGSPGDLTGRALVALAMFEAANSADPQYASYLGLPAGTAAASPEAAVLQATHDVLVARYPARASALSQALAFNMARIPADARREEGIRLGRAAAAAVLARPMSRGPGPDYRPAAQPGIYVPTDLPVLPMALLTANCWFIDSPSALRPPPPPALGSSRYRTDWDEVRRLGRRTGSERTPDQTASATFWAGNDPGPALRRLAQRPGRSLVQNARFYAIVAMSQADSLAAVADAKYAAAFWRPMTAIRNADLDDDPATSVDPAWEPLLPTPRHPEYPCGHCISAATLAAVVTAEFGPDATLEFLAPSIPGASRSVTPADYVREVSMSRIYAGVHYRFSNEAAEAMGAELGRRASGFMPPLRP